MGQLSPAFSEGWRSQPPFRGLKAKPRSKNVDPLLYRAEEQQQRNQKLDQASLRTFC